MNYKHLKLGCVSFPNAIGEEKEYNLLNIALQLDAASRRCLKVLLDNANDLNSVDVNKLCEVDRKKVKKAYPSLKGLNIVHRSGFKTYTISPLFLIPDKNPQALIDKWLKYAAV